VIHKYTDDKGNFLMAVSSSIPGMTIVPPGQTPADGEQISHTEFTAMVDEAARAVVKPQPTIESLTVLLAQAQADLQKLKDNQH
jgi:hypothetical protein